MNNKLLTTFYNVELTHWWFQGRRSILKRLILHYIDCASPLRILDIGCGTGSDLSLFGEIGQVSGIDRSPLAVRYCHKRGFSKVKVGDALSLPFKKHTFDLIALLDVLEHIENDESALQEALRVLKPGGTILITVPALPFLWSSHDTMQNHFRRYTPSRLTKLAKHAKLAQCYISYFNFFFLIPIIAIRLLSKVAFFSFLTSINYGPNFGITKRKILNNLLAAIFRGESVLLPHLHFPIGVSLVTILKKDSGKFRSRHAKKI